MESDAVTTTEYSNDDESFDDLKDLHESIINDDLELLAQVLDSDHDVNTKFTHDVSPEHEGMTPLALASALNKAEAVKLLLDNNADVSITFAALNTTVLMTSSFHGHSKVVNLLLKAGANVKDTDMQGSTALGYALGGSRNFDVIHQLLCAGVDVNHKNMLGMNALLLVAGYGDEQMVRLVLESGADVNATNDFGHTALHLAVVSKRSQLKRLMSGQATNQFGLNRHDINVALKEFVRVNSELIRDGNKNEAELEKVGQLMMEIGRKLRNPDTALEDDQEAMNCRVEAVYQCRQEKVREFYRKNKNNSVLNSFLACGGKRSKAAKRMKLQDSPSPSISASTVQLTPDVEHEVKEISQRCCQVLRLLVDAKCDVNAVEKSFGVTALDMAILLGDVESTAILMGAGGNPSHLMQMFAMSDLFEAIVKRDKKFVKELIVHDTDVLVNECFTKFNATQHRVENVKENMKVAAMTPLAVAAQIPDAEIFDILKLLLKYGADINRVGPGASSPLAEAASAGNLKMVEFLVRHGADMERTEPEYNGATAVVIAVMNRHLPVVNFLIHRNAKVDKPMSDGNSALLKASENIDQPMIEKLLTANLTKNFYNKSSFTYTMAERYQKDKDMKSILSAISDENRKFILASKPPDVSLVTVQDTAETPQPSSSTTEEKKVKNEVKNSSVSEDLDQFIPVTGEHSEDNIKPNGVKKKKKLEKQSSLTDGTDGSKTTDQSESTYDENDDGEDLEDIEEEEEEDTMGEEETIEEEETVEEEEEEYSSTENSDDESDEESDDDDDDDDDDSETTTRDTESDSKVRNDRRYNRFRKNHIKFARKVGANMKGKLSNDGRMKSISEDDRDNETEEFESQRYEYDSAATTTVDFESESCDNYADDDTVDETSEMSDRNEYKNKKSQKSVMFAVVKEEENTPSEEERPNSVIRKIPSGQDKSSETVIPSNPSETVDGPINGTKPSQSSAVTPPVEPAVQNERPLVRSDSVPQKPARSFQVNTSASLDQPNTLTNSQSATPSIDQRLGVPPPSATNENSRVPSFINAYIIPAKPSSQAQMKPDATILPYGSPPPLARLASSDEDDDVSESFEEESFEEKYQSVSQDIAVDTYRPPLITLTPTIVTDIVTRVAASSFNQVQYATIALAEIDDFDNDDDDDDDDDDVETVDDVTSMLATDDDDITEEYSIKKSVMSYQRQQQQRLNRIAVETEI